jgi:TonB family protein
MSRSKIASALLFAALMTGSATVSPAQAPSDSACRVRLNAASTDSQTTQLAVEVTSRGSPDRITPHFASMVAQGIVQMVRIPRPLPLGVYEAMNKGAWQTVRGTYLASLHRDGHLTRARSAGGTSSTAFDAALVAAIVALDTSGMIPAPDSARLAADSIDLRIAIARDPSYSPNRPAQSVLADGAPVPLMRIRVPIREGSGGPYPKPGNRAPIYPTALRNARIDGSVRLAFVVGADGTVDMSSIQVVRATAEPFIRAVLDALPAMRFFPLTVEGCPVAGVAEMPFTFSVTGNPPPRADDERASHPRLRNSSELDSRHSYRMPS